VSRTGYTMIVVKHRSASSRLDSLWEFDPVRKAIDLVFRLGSASPAAFTIPVCSLENPRFGAHVLARLDEDSWRLLPSFYIVSEAEEVVAGIELYGVPALPPGRAMPIEPRDCRPLFDEDKSPCRLHALIGCGTHIILSNASGAVALELLEL